MKNFQQKNNIQNNIKLTIGIPSFNGEQTIRLALESIIRQVEEGVEIVISDNASTGKAPQTIHQFQKKYPIKYFRNSENVGFDKNVDLVVRRSTGRFVCLFTDDYMMENAIEAVLEIIDKNPEVAEIYVHSLYPIIKLKEDKVCSGDDFFGITKG